MIVSTSTAKNSSANNKQRAIQPQPMPSIIVFLQDS